ncbi:uncharacterized protein DS421_7g216550 [Arachis hypogaea]|nr:uncharacterized protein DS421_7g216550 [Arachis hypogaea]
MNPNLLYFLPVLALSPPSEHNRLIECPFSPSVVPSPCSKASPPSPSQIAPPSSRYPSLSRNCVAESLIHSAITTKCDEHESNGFFNLFIIFILLNKVSSSFFNTSKKNKKKKQPRFSKNGDSFLSR